ncbi:MAG: nucleotidyl transferase AbiEii/AbiGii toxin family protein [Candidatus Micrarchaeota archaeon]|nr:nucleotidyl transferase AbiEii/AbiGii toxin family protein [Candidatus Micrarchaeota archaeon]
MAELRHLERKGMQAQRGVSSATLLEVNDRLSQVLRGEYAIMGGQAVRLWTGSEPRNTDIDILVRREITRGEFQQLSRLGLQYSVSDLYEKGLVYTAPRSQPVRVDIVYRFGDLDVSADRVVRNRVMLPVPRDESISNAGKAAELPVMDIPTLVALKALRGQGKDWEDIKRLAANYDGLTITDWQKGLITQVLRDGTLTAQERAAGLAAVLR